MKNYFKLFVVAFIFAISCSDTNNETPTVTTVEEDQENIESTITEFYNCMQSLESGDLSQFILQSLFDSTGEFNDTHINNIFETFETQYGALTIDDRFQFSNRLGTYTWDSTNQNWTMQNNSNAIVFQFPSIENQASADMEISISGFQDTSVSYDSEQVWLPTSVNASMKQNNNELFSLSLSGVTFDVNDNFSMPTNANITIYTAPYTHTIQWTRNTSTEFQFEFGIQNGASCTSQIFTTVQLQDSNYGNITSLEEDVVQANGSILHNNFKIEFSANIENLAAIEEPTVTEINTYVDAEVFYNNAKIGDLVYDEINDEVEVFIVYSDGTRDNVDVYTDDFLQELEFIFAEYL